MAFVNIAPATATDGGKVATAYVHGYDLAVFCVGDQLYATDRWCPHARGDLSEGALRGCQLTCNDHGWQFDIATGECLKASGGRPLSTYPVRVRDGHIQVDLPE